MKIHISNAQRDLGLDRAQIRTLVADVLRTEGVVTDELFLYFVTHKKIAALHLLYFDDPTPTDCISFPIDPPRRSKRNTPPHVLGEIFVAPKAAIEYITKHPKRGNSVERELALYIIHGLLHLIGYDDLETRARTRMRRAEKRHLRRVIFPV